MYYYQIYCRTTFEAPRNSRREGDWDWEFKEKTEGPGGRGQQHQGGGNAEGPGPTDGSDELCGQSPPVSGQIDPPPKICPSLTFSINTAESFILFKDTADLAVFLHCIEQDSIIP